MCGRFFIDMYNDRIQEFYEIAQEKFPEKILAREEIFPSNYVLTFGANKKGEIVPGITKWGFTGFKKSQLLINARYETVTEKPTFKEPFLTHRCVFLMSAYYEWNKKKEKHFIKTDDIMFAAGFFHQYKQDNTIEFESTMLTQDAAPEIEHIHHRMPVILGEEQIEQWIKDTDFALQRSIPQPESFITRIEK